MTRPLHPSRRAFLKTGVGVLPAMAIWPGWTQPAGTGPRPRHRAVIVGHTGHGDFGHGYDRVFNGLQGVTVTAVADPDDAGARRAAERSGAVRTYRDYRRMFDAERPDLVCIAMRQPAGHLEIALAAMEHARGLFLEKPMTETLPQADALCRAAAERGVAVGIAHNRRFDAEFCRARALIAAGFAGEIREVNMHGKQDSRAGGEDLIVLGTHDFDLLRWWFGDPGWCSATVSVEGRDVGRADIRRGSEPMRVAGDTVHALFGLRDGMVARWSSVTTRDDWTTRRLKRERWAFEILGSRRIVAWQSGIGFRYLDSPFHRHPDASGEWQLLPEAPAGSAAGLAPGADLVAAVESGGQPRCSAVDGRWTIEMLTAVYQSHFTRSRVNLPLDDRSNPLA
jgi:predicted dehydrogenase